MWAPVTCADAGEQRNRATPAMSVGPPMRPKSIYTCKRKAFCIYWQKLTHWMQGCELLLAVLLQPECCHFWCKKSAIVRLENMMYRFSEAYPGKMAFTLSGPNTPLMTLFRYMKCELTWFSCDRVRQRVARSSGSLRQHNQAVQVNGLKHPNLQLCSCYLWVHTD